MLDEVNSCHNILNSVDVISSLVIKIMDVYWKNLGTVVKVLCYKSEGRWFDPSWCQWIFH